MAAWKLRIAAIAVCIAAALGCGAAPDERGLGGAGGNGQIATGETNAATPDGKRLGGAAGYGPATTSRAGRNPDIGTSQDELLVGSWISQEFSLTATHVEQNRIQLKPTFDSTGQQWVCLLTYVGGPFNGLGEYVKVYEENGWWYLDVQNSVGWSTQLTGKARCFDKTAVATPQSWGQARWVSAPFVTSGQNPDGCYSNAHQTAAWWGDAWTYLTGTQGGLDGGGEWDQVIQSTVWNQPSFVGIGNCREDDHRTNWAHSFFAGQPGNPVLAKFIGWDFSATANQTVQMASSHSTICGFTHISGLFNDASDFVEIFDQGNIWFLRANKWFGSESPPTVRAKCYMRVQT